MTATAELLADCPAAVPYRPLRVTLVDEELPYPPVSGKRIRTLNLTLRLARRHRLTYVCHRNADAAEARRAAEFFGDHGIATVVVDRAVPPKAGAAFYARLALNLLSPLPYSVAGRCAAPCGPRRPGGRSICGTASGRLTPRRCGPWTGRAW